MIKRSVKYILSFLAYYSGIVSLLRAIQKKQAKLKVIVYHRVNDDPEGSSPELPVSRFRQQMAYLSRHYNVADLTEAVEDIRSGRGINQEAVAVTFDDGYKDVIINALPIIKEFNIAITVFLASGGIGEGKMLWPDELYFFFKEKNRLNEFYQFKENLKKVDDNKRTQILNGCKPELRRSLMLNWDDVKKLSNERYVTLGAHTQTHVVLTQADKSVSLKEIADSKKDIEREINSVISGFSYPTGKYDLEIKNQVMAAGFAYACSVDGKFNTENSDLYALSRITAVNCPIFVFAVELCGILNLFRR